MLFNDATKTTKGSERIPGFEDCSKHTKHGTPCNAQKSASGTSDTEIDRFNDEPQVWMIPNHILEELPDLPQGLTATMNGFQYKGKPWPAAGNICSKCNTTVCIKTVHGFGKQTPYTWCVKCKRSVTRVRRSTKRGYLQYIAQQMVARSRYTNRECTIDVDFLHTLWEKQDGVCALSGLNMTHTYDTSTPQRLILNASVDRIDSNYGYTPGNVQLVAVRLNLMKGPLDEVVFKDLCYSVHRQRGMAAPHLS